MINKTNFTSRNPGHTDYSVLVKDVPDSFSVINCANEAPSSHSAVICNTSPMFLVTIGHPSNLLLE